MIYEIHLAMMGCAVVRDNAEVVEVGVPSLGRARVIARKDAGVRIMRWHSGHKLNPGAVCWAECEKQEHPQ
jgi:hypothetical protein